MMLAHFDASGTMGDSAAFVMAGYLASAEAWEQFSLEWQAVLDLEPKLDYFKMMEANALTQQFSRSRGWTEALRDDRLCKLVAVTHKYAVASVMFVVSTSAWRRHFTGQLARPYHDRPYYFTFYGVMANVVKYLRHKGIEDTIDCIFDNEGGEPLTELIDGFNGWVAIAPPEFKVYIGDPPIFRDEKKVLPIQAADMLAWHCRRAFYEAVESDETGFYSLSVVAREIFDGIENIKSLWGEPEVEDARRSVWLNDLAQTATAMSLPDPSSGWGYPLK
jgi:Protein of unknown function (DUF3800)